MPLWTAASLSPPAPSDVSDREAGHLMGQEGMGAQRVWVESSQILSSNFPFCPVLTLGCR